MAIFQHAWLTCQLQQNFPSFACFSERQRLDWINICPTFCLATLNYILASHLIIPVLGWLAGLAGLLAAWLTDCILARPAWLPIQAWLPGSQLDCLVWWKYWKACNFIYSLQYKIVFQWLIRGLLLGSCCFWWHYQYKQSIFHFRLV